MRRPKMAKTMKFKTGYTRCTRAQLISCIKKYKTELTRVANAPMTESFGGKTHIQYASKIKKHLRTAAKTLRANVLADIDWKINELRTQMASRLGVPVSSTSTITPAVKRLTAKRKAIVCCKTISGLVSQVRTFKVSSFKNPKYSAKAYAKTAWDYAKGTSGKGATSKKYRTETKKLRREIKSLKNKNGVLRRQVSKFRKEVAKLQRHYTTLNRTPNWKVVSGGATKTVGKEVSNIVRISNALTSALGQQRKAG